MSDDMSEIIPDLEAIGKFLISYEATQGLEAAHQAATRQLAHLLKKIKASKFTAVQATTALTAITTAPWPSVESGLLCDAIESSMNTSATMNNQRNRTQRCDNLMNFLTVGLVKFMHCPPIGPSRIKLDFFAEFLVHLGIRWPSEKLVQLAVGLLITVLGDTEMTDDGKLSLLRDIKRMIKDNCKKIAEAGAVIWDYPEHPTDLPAELFNKIYSGPDGAAAQLMVDRTSLERTAAGVPMRSTRTYSSGFNTSSSPRSSSGAAANPMMMMQMFQSMMRGCQTPCMLSLPEMPVVQKVPQLLALPPAPPPAPVPDVAADPPGAKADAAEEDADSELEPTPVVAALAPSAFLGSKSKRASPTKPNLDQIVGIIAQAAEKRKKVKDIEKENQLKLQAEIDVRPPPKNKARRSQGGPKGTTPELATNFGCSKCRGSPEGCKGCRNPNFKGKRVTRK
jgi:hypothetical protein